jgi:class 3 adenylate cyclase
MGPIGPLRAENMPLALSIIAEIQNAEKARLDVVTQERAEHYTVMLASIAQDAIAQEYNVDLVKGQELLEEMRKADIRKIRETTGVQAISRPKPTKSRTKVEPKPVRTTRSIPGIFIEEEMGRLLEEAAHHVQVKQMIRSLNSPHIQSYEKFGKSSLASVLCIDLLGLLNLHSDDAQRHAIELLNAIIRHSILAVEISLDEVVSLAAGEGLSLCFSSQVDGPLRVAEEIQVALAEHNRNRSMPKKKISIRMGIDVGQVLRVRDLHGDYSLIGKAILTAQRAMSVGKAGHILCTQNAYRQFARMKEYRHALKPINEPFTVKHGVRMKLYTYVRPRRGVGRVWESKLSGVISGGPAEGAN